MDVAVAAELSQQSVIETFAIFGFIGTHETIDSGCRSYVVQYAGIGLGPFSKNEWSTRLMK